MNKKRLVIAGTRSGVGKTTISLGLMAALTKRGLQVQPYKVGPDYIDPAFHTFATGNKSHNLDSYFLTKEGVKELFTHSAKKSDIAIIEGVMGLFDGKGKRGVSSTAEIAKTLKAPVLLIIDGKKMAQSGAALAYGYKNYDTRLNVAGVILNNIASKRHYHLLKEAIEAEPVGLKVLGYIPRQKELQLPERHLGLVPTHESEELESFLDDLVAVIEKNIDLDKLIELAGDCQRINLAEKKLYNQKKEFDVKIAIAYDQAFNFYYQYNLELLKNMGAKLCYFSPINDKSLPEADGIYLGGGFPESFLEELAVNKGMKEDIKEKARLGMPVYAECGGLMYLSEAIIDTEENIYPMVGLLAARTKMKNSLQEMGYREIEALRDNIILDRGELARGHVFHYSNVLNLSTDIKYCYQSDNNFKGYSSLDNLLASYVHLHFSSNTNIAHNFLYNAQLFKNSQEI